MLKRTYHIQPFIYPFVWLLRGEIGFALHLWQTWHDLQQTDLRKMKWMLMGQILSQMSNCFPSTMTLTFNWHGWRILFAYSLTEGTILLKFGENLSTLKGYMEQTGNQTFKLFWPRPWAWYCHGHCLRRRDTKESTYLLRHITTEKSGLCQYAVCIIQHTS